ncbi:hypothetical protein DAI43_17135 [Achromobacter xylosoxidans]|uniref:hypothetical protein n=1 Tax=Achromobacter aegrifaciens TaxID=1287736 RepID=UPI000D4E478C|nr:hypothetical protein [Achromobacter aegrifaciens]MDQ1759008.1 hypothetical protein [Achromobacter aegrifaciens]PTN50418.1 hypothetical protein DAI43_17135 [Achromobacter xylosoxidans]
MTTTHEQTARNTEIVQRRLAGETTGVLAREYDVTPTRIAQLVRRHREKAGEIPTKPRAKAAPRHAKPAHRIRPRLRKDELGLWECFDEGMSRRGETLREAYDRWLNASLASLFDKQLAPYAAKVAKEPEQPYRGPVTVVPGVRPGQALRLPQSLLLNGARARAAQPYTPSLSGGRRGGE